MSQVPADLHYTKDHEWLQPSGAELKMGITDYAQAALGDVTFIELPRVGAHYDEGANLCVVESVKAASEVYMPVAGTVVSVNDALANSPEAINQDPYGAGYIALIKPDNAADVAKLLGAAAYARLV
jgi:glycine cleavage system H protein